jgi:hypothetical protein
MTGGTVRIALLSDSDDEKESQTIMEKCDFIEVHNSRFASIHGGVQFGTIDQYQRLPLADMSFEYVGDSWLLGVGFL